MSLTTKILTIRVQDLTGEPVGTQSVVALAEVSACYDRDILVGGGWRPRFPKVLDGSADGVVRVQVLANDDPAIIEGAGFKVCIRVRLHPVRGLHATETRAYREVAITSSMPAEVSLADLPQPIAAPWFLPGSNLAGVALWTDPDTGEQIPYLADPSAGTLTIFGGFHA